MFKIFAIFIFYAMIGSIVSPDEHPPAGKDGKVEEVAPSSHQHSSTAPVPPTTVKEEHGGGLGQVVTSDPHHPAAPNPIIDYTVMSWLKKKTSYGKPIEQIQKSSTELLKNLHNLVLQEVHKQFPEVEAFKPDHKVDGSTVKESFNRLIQDVNELKNHSMNQNFKNTKQAYSSLKEDPNDEHRQKQMKKALVNDVSSNLSGLWYNPITSGQKLLRHMGLIEDNDGVKQNHEHEMKEGHQVEHKDGKSGHEHDHDHDTGKNGQSVEHSEHGAKPAVSSEPNHNHSDQKIEPKHSDGDIKHDHRGEEMHSKEKDIHHTNSGHQQGDAPPQTSVLEGLVETFFTYVPIHKVFT